MRSSKPCFGCANGSHTFIVEQTGQHLAVCQNLVPLVNIKIAGKWMFIPLKMVLIGIDPYPFLQLSQLLPKPFQFSTISFARLAAAEASHQRALPPSLAPWICVAKHAPDHLPTAPSQGYLPQNLEQRLPRPNAMSRHCQAPWRII